jgi:flagella basal body P-ring formation protein FlgA
LSAKRLRAAFACLGWLACAVAGVPANAGVATAAEASEIARARAAVVESIQGRLGPDVQVDLDAFICRLAPDAPDTLMATPDLTGRTGRSMRFTFANAQGPGGRVVRVGEATAVVHVSGPHVRAVRPIDAGRTLTPEDVALDDGPIDNAPLRRLSTLDEVIGARTVRPLAAGDPVVQGVVVGVPVVRAGDRVRATVRVMGIEAVVVAVAEQNGMPDQIIRVVNPDSRRAVRARVVAKGEVEVVHGR